MEEDDGLTYEDAELTQGSPCEVCGNEQFYNEAGFYYCTICSSQSQQSRVYVVEESFVSGRLNARAAGVLRKPATKKSENIRGNSQRRLSIYEVSNLILKDLTDQLINLGFPRILKDKVFHLWMTFLKKRGAVFVSQSDETKNYPVYAEKSSSSKKAFSNLTKFRRKPASTIKKKIKKEDVPLDNLESVSLKKKRRSMNQRHAFEMEYHASNASQDATYANGDDSSVNQQNTKTERKVTNRVKMKKTRQFKILASSLKAEGFKLDGTEFGPNKRLCTLLSPEIFHSTKVLSLIFIALRQIGCSIVLSDILRMLSDGTISLLQYTESGEFLKGVESYMPPHLLKKFRRATFELIIFCGGVESFNYPSYAEFLPKYVDALVLPRELECLAIQLDRLVPQEEDAVLKKEQYLTIELYVLSVLIVTLKMLFGLDGVTEKYQSEFARTVNKLIADSAQSHDTENVKTEWIELFVMEDWINYLRYREYLVKAELYSPAMHNPLSTLNLTLLNHILDKSVPIPREGKRPLISPAGVSQHKETMALVQSLFKEPATSSGPSQVPNYTTFGVPNQSLVDQFKENYPYVFRPEFHPQFLKDAFLKKRIDFVYNPSNYIDLLKEANIEVEVRKGDARNYKPSSRKDITCKKRLVLFQPYRNFDCDTCCMDLCSPTFDFILNECSSLLGNRENVKLTRSSLEPAIMKLNNFYMKNCYQGWVSVIFPDYIASDTDSDDGI